MSDSLRVRGGAGGVSAQFEHLDEAAVHLFRSAGALSDAAGLLRLGRSSLDALTGLAAHPLGAAALDLDLVAVWGQLEAEQLLTAELGASVVGAVGTYRAAEATEQVLWSATLADVALTLWKSGVGLRAGLMLLLPHADALGRLADGPPDDHAVPEPDGDGPVTGGPPPVTLGDPRAAALTAALPPDVQRQLAGVAPPEGAQLPVPPSGQDESSFLTPARVEPFVALTGAVIAGPGAVVGARSGAPAASRWMVARMRDLEVAGGTATTLTPVAVPPAQASASPPRTTTELLRRVKEAGDGGGGAPGRVRVEQFVRPDGRRAAVLYLSGTQTWTTSSKNPYDLTTNLEAIAQESSSVADAAKQALRQAGVTSDEELVIVGHSEGGIAAAQLVTDPAFQAEFTTVGLVTAGSPIGAFDIPADVEVMALEHDDDWVPILDGAQNPDRSTLTTVFAPAPEGINAHALTGYEVTAEAVDASDDPSLVAARERLSGFLASASPTSQVSDYAAERVR